jgi:hypothetical protein
LNSALKVSEKVYIFNESGLFEKRILKIPKINKKALPDAYQRPEEDIFR